MTKQQQIETLQAENKELIKEIENLKKRSSDDFKESPLYKQMHTDLMLARTLSDVEHQLTLKHKTDMQLTEQFKKIRDDNRELCKQHDVVYWEGISAPRSWNEQDIQKLQKEILSLKSQLAAKDELIDYLKYKAVGEVPPQPVHETIGRPPVEEEKRRRIIEMRKDGWTIKQIAEAESVSVGFVSQLCRS